MPRWTDADRTPLAVLRAKGGLSRNEAAVKLNVGLTTLGRYEIGANDVPMGVAEQMATLYGVTFDEVRAAVAETQAKPEELATVSGEEQGIQGLIKKKFPKNITGIKAKGAKKQ